MTGKAIFKNEEHQKLFDKQGFIVLPFLTSDEVNEMDNLFDELHPNINQGGFFSGSYSTDYDYKVKASKGIVNTFSRAYDELFINYKPFGGAFLYKVPGVNSELAVHQDWTIVDESKNVALNCWVPLCDITLENGPIMIMPGSQFDRLNVVRAPTLPFFFSGQDDMVMRELIPMEVKAGTAVILNQSVIHYSPPNNSDKIRKAITAGVKSRDAQMYFHYKVPNQEELEVFEVPDDFFLNFKDFIRDMSKRPYWGTSIGFVPYKLPQLTGEDLYGKLKEMKEMAGYKMNSSNEGYLHSKQNQQPIKQNFFKRTFKRLFS
jgi:hypothetical protein